MARPAAARPAHPARHRDPRRRRRGPVHDRHPGRRPGGHPRSASKDIGAPLYHRSSPGHPLRPAERGAALIQALGSPPSARSSA